MHTLQQSHTNHWLRWYHYLHRNPVLGGLDHHHTVHVGLAGIHKTVFDIHHTSPAAVLPVITQSQGAVQAVRDKLEVAKVSMDAAHFEAVGGVVGCVAILVELRKRARVGAGDLHCSKH